MSELVIHCPSCGKGLKLRDSSKLGKKAKCPKCAHVFRMKNETPPVDDDEDEVEFQVAGSAAQTVEGAAGRWVPDNAPAELAPAPQPSQVVPPVQPFAPETAPGVAPVHQPAVTSTAQAAPGLGTPPVIQTAPAPASAPSGFPVDAEGGVARLKELKRKGARRRNFAILMGTVTALAVGGAIYAAKSHLDETRRQAAAEKKPKRDAEKDALKEELLANTEEAKDASPTSGNPVSLVCLPMGAKLIVSCRPAAFWETGSQGEEVRAGLGALFSNWVTESFKDLIGRDPSEIKHAVIGFIPGQVGDPPQVCGVFQFVEKQNKGQWIVQMGAERSDEYGYPVYKGEKLAYVLKDVHTVAVAPVELAEELATSVNRPHPQSDGIDAIINQTDDERHLTLVFEPRSVARHRDMMFPESTWLMVDRFMEFFNDEEIETVAWSMHVGEKRFHSEMLMRNQNIIREHQLQEEMKRKLKQAPYDIWHMVEKMDPRQRGPRKLIGRFPAMTQVFAKSTVGGMGNRYAQLVTSLPERAAPNLAAAGLFTWLEANQTDFSKAAPVKPEQTGPKLPDLVAQRLELEVDAEFNRVPLQNAFDFIAEECHTKVEIDGEALKFKGFTKNMPQNFTVKTSGLKVIKKIIDQYEDMCVVIDEKKKLFLVTTTPFAEDQGLKPDLVSVLRKE